MTKKEALKYFPTQSLIEKIFDDIELKYKPYRVVRLFSNEDREEIEEPKWHLVVTSCGDKCTLCTREYFDFGAGVEKYEMKMVEKDEIDCKDCIKIIKQIQSIKLEDKL